MHKMLNSNIISTNGEYATENQAYNPGIFSNKNKWEKLEDDDFTWCHKLDTYNWNLDTTILTPRLKYIIENSESC